MPAVSQMKFCSLQNSFTAFSWTTEADGDKNNQKNKK